MQRIQLYTIKQTSPSGVQLAQNVLGDVERRTGATDSACAFAHRRQAGRLGQQVLDSIRYPNWQPQLHPFPY
jgi:hypothetical protein